MAISQLVWLRNDIRLNDHPAINLAQQDDDIALVVCLTPEQWQEHNESPAKNALRFELTTELQQQAHKLGIPCHILELKRFSDCPEAIADLCLEHHYTTVWWQNELPVHEAQRDECTAKHLDKVGVTTRRFAPDLIVSEPVLNQQGQPFKVFTPFYKRWLSTLSANITPPYECPNNQEPPTSFPSEFKCYDIDDSYRQDLWPADYQIIKEKLWHFCHHKEADYDELRDFPAKPNTSTLSPYLALGAIGPRECLEAIIHTSGNNERDWHGSVWLKELAWRDFYKQLMGHFPDLSKSLPFKPETQHLVWNHNTKAFKAWCEGNTGFPIVDAAMRQLNQTGWMHNRLRMITASFLTKLLFVDWREGERYFMEHLIDGEFAANNGGWQWSASTGCDAAPYFRVFNPTRQSERFDPDGVFIKRFVPELKILSGKSIHDPNQSQRKQCGYPEPIIDYKKARQYAIAAFDDLKGQTT